MTRSTEEVWVLWEYFVDGRYLVGIYCTEEAAMKAKLDWEQKGVLEDSHFKVTKEVVQ